ncbi:MAG: hypothetical protein HYY16_19685 [Planctomycetes bacterium]|nr:hypothetical protein [Planctomycetota bacterium]
MEPRFRRVTRDDSFDRRRIEEALRKTKGNLFDAARHLRISCAALARKIRRFGLEG